MLGQKILSDTQKVNEEMHCGIDTRAKDTCQQWLFKAFPQYDLKSFAATNRIQMLQEDLKIV